MSFLPKLKASAGCAMLGASVSLLLGMLGGGDALAQAAATPSTSPIVVEHRTAWRDPLREVADRDPAEAFAKVAASYQGEVRERYEGTLAAYLLEKDFTKVGEVLARVTEPMARQRALIDVVPRACQRDRAGTLRTIREQLSGHDRSYAQWQAARVLVHEQAWAEVIELHRSMEPGSDRSQVTSELGRNLATGDLDLALEWRAKLADAEQKQAHNRILDALSQASDPGGLMRLLAVTPAQDEVRPGGYISWNRRMMIGRITWLLQDRGDLATRDALREALPPGERDMVDVIIISGDKAIAPAARLTRIAELKDGHARTHGANWVVAAEWEKDPVATKALVLGLPETVFGSAFAALASKWNDSAAVAAWVKSMDAGPKREKAIQQFVMHRRYSREEAERALVREVVTWLADADAREKLAREIRF